ncbi:DUF397 domain-containing protein [Streptomyces cuspidosporus]|uniref:DUF397 domain-containing protein n=1 Tax=Streptomyces cuspidosporus TaxID=66882 RepID=A0ABN3G3I0_9ACTN
MKSAHHIAANSSSARWRRSTYSGGNNECVEIADNLPELVHVRDSKRPAGPVIRVNRAAWSAFITHLR